MVRAQRDLIPFLPFGGYLGFVRLQGSVLVTLAAITVLYVVATELAKRRFYRVAA